AEIASFLQFAVAHYDVDPQRVYLTGLSCGAIGGWNYLAQHLDDTVVAAAMAPSTRPDATWVESPSGRSTARWMTLCLSVTAPIRSPAYSSAPIRRPPMPALPSIRTRVMTRGRGHTTLRLETISTTGCWVTTA